MELNNESKTLFIPLQAKAKMSKKGLFLTDKKAEEIVNKINNNLKNLKQSKWLSMFLSLRALIIDELCNNFILTNPKTTVIHLGCGLDSRCLRVNQNFKTWYDVDFEPVIDIRKEFFKTTTNYKMIKSSVTDFSWMKKIEKAENILIVAEGLTMYLTEDEIKNLILEINKDFGKVYLIFDAYSKKAVKLSKIKNPVNKVKAKIKFGFNDPKEFLLLNSNLEFVKEHNIRKINNGLTGFKKFIFNNLYCGKLSQSLYKIYEFNLKD